MEVYIFLFVITTIVSLLDFTNLSNKYKYGIILFLGIIYIFISGFRGNNQDWNIYYPFFRDNFTWNDFIYNEIDPMDKGYAFINFIIKSFTDNYNILLFLLAIVIITIKLNFIIRLSIFPLISLIYWLGSNITDIFFVRQQLSVAITIIAFYFILKRNIVGFLFFTIIASAIQISAIAFFPAYYIFYKRIKIKYLIYGILFSIFVGNFLKMDIFLKIWGLFGTLLPDSDRLSDKVDLYAYYYDASKEASTFIMGYIRRLLFLPLELWAILKIEKYLPNYRGYINLIVLGCIIQFLLGNVSTIIAGRMSSFYNVYEIILLPAILILIRSIKLRFLAFLVILFLSILKYAYAINEYPDVYIPYINILFN